MVKITAEFEEKLKNFIVAFEQKTPIEIVPVIVKRATNYNIWSYSYGFILSYLPSRFLAQYLPFWSFATVILDAFVWLFLGFIVAYILRRMPFFTYLIPLEMKREAALQMSESIFLNQGVHETKQRLGVLIAVYEFERSVIVLADKGFYPLVKTDYWAKLGVTLAKDFNHQKPGDEFFEALGEIERDIAPQFKVDGANPNELSDELRKK